MTIQKSKGLLLNNYLEKDIQKLFYPFYLLQHIFLMTKYTIRDNFIYPNGPKLNTSISIFWTVLSILFFYNIYYTYGKVNENFYSFNSKTQYIIIYFYKILNNLGIITFLILNLVHSDNNVLLILNVQTIHKHIKINAKCSRQYIKYNWVSCVIIISVDVFIIVLYYIKGVYLDYTHALSDYLLKMYDLNIIYAIRIATMLEIYLKNFKNKYLVINSTQDCDNIFKIYKTLMRTYILFNKIFNFMVI